MRRGRANKAAGSAFAALRNRMVDVQLVQRGIRDGKLLNAMRRVPREVFVPECSEEFAYDDAPLLIAEGQAISQPYIVAAMIEAASLRKTDRVLEVGAGSGYAAAVMSRIVRRVYAIERHATLSKAAARRVSELGYRNIELRTGDGTKGWPEEAPFDAILVAASGPNVPPALCQQLTVGGRLIIPIDKGWRRQMLLRIVRRSDADFDEEDIGAVRFVPLIAEEG